MFSTKALLTAGGIALATAGGASAATLDFTSFAGGATSGTLAGSGITWTLTAVNGTINADTPYDPSAPGGTSPLANKTDGVGVIGKGERTDDEVTMGFDEELILSFSRRILLTGVHVLDLFVPESASALNADDDSLLATLIASHPLGESDGYAFSGTKAVEVKSIRFIAGGAPDDVDSDFALAAIDYRSNPDGSPAPVPLPAGGLMLLGALGGLGIARRRRNKMA